MTAEIFLPALRDVLLKSVAGVQAAFTYDDLPASLQALPAWVVMVRTGSQEFGGSSVALYEVQAVLYHSPANLPEAYAFLTPSIDKVRRAIANNLTLGGLVSRVAPVFPPAPWFEGPGAINSIYGDKAYIGIIFNLQVKETGANFEIKA